FINFFFFQAEDGIRDATVTGVQTCALPISQRLSFRRSLLLRRLFPGGSLLAHSFSLCFLLTPLFGGHTRSLPLSFPPGYPKHASLNFSTACCTGSLLTGLEIHEFQVRRFLRDVQPRHAYGQCNPAR